MNDQVNPAAAGTQTTPEPDTRSSGSTLCSPLLVFMGKYHVNDDLSTFHEFGQAPEEAKVHEVEHTFCVVDPSRIVAITNEGYWQKWRRESCFAHLDNGTKIDVPVHTDELLALINSSTTRAGVSSIVVDVPPLKKMIVVPPASLPT